MSWVVALLAMSWMGDGGSSEPPPLFHEPMTRPVPLTKMDLSLPAEVIQERTAGLVILRCVIAETGVVEDCEVIKSVPKLTEWALKKMKGACYTPVTLEGRPIRVRYVFDFNVRAHGVPPNDQPGPWRPQVPPNIAQACRGTNAPICRETAMSILTGDAGPADVDKAGRLLGAACDQGIEPACQTLIQLFEAPRMLQDLPAPLFEVPTAVEGNVSCLISADGRPHDCIAQPGPMSDWVVSTMPGVRFAPAKYRGRPFETEHAIRYVIPGRR